MSGNIILGLMLIFNVVMAFTPPHGTQFELLYLSFGLVAGFSFGMSVAAKLQHTD